MILTWKEYFSRAILSFTSPMCAIIARLNVIYTKFRCTMITQLNKIWRVRVRTHATHGQAWVSEIEDWENPTQYFLDQSFCNKNQI